MAVVVVAIVMVVAEVLDKLLLIHSLVLPQEHIRQLLEQVEINQLDNPLPVLIRVPIQHLIQYALVVEAVVAPLLKD